MKENWQHNHSTLIWKGDRVFEANLKLETSKEKENHLFNLIWGYRGTKIAYTIARLFVCILNIKHNDAKCGF